MMTEDIREKFLGWGTVASDPALFSEILKDSGVSHAQVEEIYSLDDDVFESLKPVYGLIFLFRVRQDAESESGEIEYTCPPNLWFANQVVENACASLALLNIIFNCPELKIGEHLESFKKFTQDLTPPLRGLALYDFEFLRKIHNGYARTSEIMRSNIDTVETCKSRRGETDESPEDLIYHFIAYVPVDSAIYELDGLKRPVRLVDLPDGSDWLSIVAPKIKERMSTYASDDAMFTLLAVVKSPLTVRREQLSENSAQLGHLVPRLEKIDPQWISARDGLDFQMSTPPSGESLEDTPDNAEELHGRVLNLIETQRIIKGEISQAEGRLTTYRRHATRTKHGYTSFLREYITLLAEKDIIQDLLLQQ